MPGTAVCARDFGWQHLGRGSAALSGVSFDIQPGERVLIAGPSGAGKSTLLAAMAGVLGGDEEGTQRGSLLLSEGARTEPPGGRIPVGLVLQDPDSQITASRVGDDVAFGCENLGVPRAEIWPRVRRALDVVGLDLALDHPTAALSGGQKQRLALAGVLAMGAGLILLDEPTANLDPAGVRDVVSAVCRATDLSGATLVVVEHNIAAWQRVVERALVLRPGGVELTTPASVAAERTAALDGVLAEVGAARSIGGVRGADSVSGVCGADCASEVGSRPAALSCTELACAFGPPRTLSIPEGASTVVTGPNGSGKSTWLLTMGGLLKPRGITSASATTGGLFGKRHKALGARAGGGPISMSPKVARGLPPAPHAWSSKQLAQRIGFVFQNPEHQFVSRSVAQELRVGPQVMGVEVPEERIDALVHRLRLEDLMEANPFTLSGGEKRRLSVATALVAAPEVVLLDEPTFGQDPETFGELIGLLRGLVDDGVTIASITHDELFIRALGDHRIDFEEAS